jgi:hypothetical protein
VNSDIKNLITEDLAVYLAKGILKNLSNINLMPTTADEIKYNQLSKLKSLCAYDETCSMELSPF